MKCKPYRGGRRARLRPTSTHHVPAAWSSAVRIEPVAVTATPQGARPARLPRLAGGLAFRDPVVRGAFERFDALVLAEPRVAGGRRMAATVPPSVALQSLFDDPPTCWLAHGGSFAPQWFPFGARPGSDGDTDWPDAGAGEDPALGSRGCVVAFTVRPEVREVGRELIGTVCGRVLAEGVVWYFPANRDFPLEAFTEDGARAVAIELHEALAADAFRFDGSDLMPPAVSSRRPVGSARRRRGAW